MILVSTKTAEQILVHKRSFDIEHDMNYELLTLNIILDKITRVE